MNKKTNMIFSYSLSMFICLPCILNKFKIYICLRQFTSNFRSLRNQNILGPTLLYTFLF